MLMTLCFFPECPTWMPNCADVPLWDYSFTHSWEGWIVLHQSRDHLWVLC